MPSQTYAYDLTLLLDPSASEDQRKRILSDTRKLISGQGGEVASSHAFGQRHMAYEITHTSDAELHVIQLVGGAKLPEAIDRYLRISDGVLRARVIKRRGGPGAIPDISKMPEPSAMPSRPIVDTPPLAERL